jgi:hypothetical protein
MIASPLSNLFLSWPFESRFVDKVSRQKARWPPSSLCANLLTQLNAVDRYDPKPAVSEAVDGIEPTVSSRLPTSIDNHSSVDPEREQRCECRCVRILTMNNVWAVDY